MDPDTAKVLQQLIVVAMIVIVAWLALRKWD